METHELEACTDCAMLIANATVPEEMTQEEATAYLERINAIWNPDAWRLVSGSKPDVDFSSSRCEVCHSRLAGTRHSVVAMERAE